MSSQAARIACRFHRRPGRGVAASQPRAGRRPGRRDSGSDRGPGPARRGGPRTRLPAASPRRHHSSAGHGEGTRPRADRRGDLRGVALSRSDLARRGAAPDADNARDGRLHRPAVGRQPLHAGRSRHAADQHRLRRLLPALPDRSLRGRRGRRARRLQRRRSRTWTGGSTRRVAWTPSKSIATCRSRKPARTWRTSRSAASNTASTTATISASERLQTVALRHDDIGWHCLPAGLPHPAAASWPGPASRSPPRPAAAAALAGGRRNEPARRALRRGE